MEYEIFSNAEFGKIRTLEIDGEPWFVGKDIAIALGYSDAFGAIKKHVDSEDKLVCQIDSSGQKRDITAIVEYGDFYGIESTYQTAYNLLENRADVNLSARVRNKQKRLMLNGATKKAIMAVSMLDVINDDKKLKEIFTAILREMLAGGVING